jgi:hypothetical protein
MGFDCDAITIVGLRIKCENLKVTEKKVEKYVNCYCIINNVDSFSYCPSCGNKNKHGTYEQFITYDIKEFHYTRDDSDGYIGRIKINNRKYRVCQPTEHEDWIYITLYKGIREGPRNYNEKETVKCELSFEELMKMRDEIKNGLIEIESHYRTIDEKFSLWSDDKFGIYTIVDYSY